MFDDAAVSKASWGWAENRVGMLKEMAHLHNQPQLLAISTFDPTVHQAPAVQVGAWEEVVRRCEAGRIQPR